MPGDGNHNALLFNTRAFKAQFDAQLCRRHFHELTHGVLNAGGNNEIFRLFLLQHHPLHFYVVFGVAPVTQGIHIAEIQARLQPLGDVGDCAGDFAGNESLATARGFMVEENTVTGVHAVGFAVVNGDPVGVQFGDRIRRAWVERRGLFLRNFLHQTVQFRSGSLIETCFLFQTEEADRLEQAQRTHRIDVCGIFR
ncbi:hypothetical protein ExPCM14_04028 [Escherichia coli]|nr:hypothetical protein ExPCM14_04028 [Escherichia coli]